MADGGSWLTRPIGELPIMQGDWWTKPTPRTGPAPAQGAGLTNSIIPGPAEALGRIAERAQAERVAAADAKAAADADMRAAQTGEFLLGPQGQSLIGGIVGGVQNVAQGIAGLERGRQALYGESAVSPGLRQPQAPRMGGMSGPAMPSSMQLGFDVERAQLEAERRAAGYDQATIEAQRQAQLQSNQAMAAQEQRDIEQAREFEARRVNYEADMAKRQTEMDELRADIASTKIDPGAYFSNMSGFSKMLSLFSVALGGFSEGYSGGRLKNVGLQMLDDAIARDVDAQKANLAAKRGKLADAQSVYGLARQKFGDDQAAMDYARARQYEQLANVAKRFQGEARTEELANKAAQLGSMFEDKKNILEQSIKQRTAQANELARARAAQAAAGPSLREIEQQLKVRKLAAETAQAESEAGIGGGAKMAKPQDVARYVPGLGAFAGSEQQANDLREGLASVATAKAKLARLQELQRSGTPGIPRTNDAAEYEALASSVIGDINKASKFGALDRGTQELLQKQIPEAGILTSSSAALKRLESAGAALDTARASAIKNTPLIPGTLVPTERGVFMQFGQGGTPAVSVRPRTPGEK